MNPAQHERVAALMNNLAHLQERMQRVKNMFPLHHAQLMQQYNQLILEAKHQRVMPPWML
jgi:hypothetical protein